MTHEEIHEAVRKVAAYANELGLHPEMIYWNADDPEQGASDPEELVEDVHDKVEVNEGIVFRDAYTVERKWENPDCDDTVAVYSSNVYVLPPGHGRAVGVDVVGFMPVGRDVLLAVFEGYSDCRSILPPLQLFLVLVPDECDDVIKRLLKTDRGLWSIVYPQVINS